VHFIPFIPVFEVVSSHLIILIQCHAIWEMSPFILLALSPLIVAETVIMSIISWKYNSAVPLLTPTGPCLPAADSVIDILYFALPMAFDLLVTVLTYIKCFRLYKHESGIGNGSALLNTIIQNSFQYVLLITATNLVNVVYYASNVSSPTSSLNGPLAVIFTELMACRLALSLREIKQNNQVSGLAPTKTRGILKVMVFGNGGLEATEMVTVRNDKPFTVSTAV